MTRYHSLAAGLFLATPALSAESEMRTPPLTLTFAREQAICTAAEKIIATEPPCRAFDIFACPRPDALKFRPVASDQYGYTEVALAPEFSSAPYAIVYLQRFRGDQVPRQMETWKIDGARLRNVFQLPPGLISFEDRYQFHPGAKSDLPPETNAKEFGELLRASEKVSDEWSATADLLGQPHAIVRECDGAWLYGAYYRCDRVTKLTFLKLSEGAAAERSCEFALADGK